MMNVSVMWCARTVFTCTHVSYTNLSEGGGKGTEGIAGEPRVSEDVQTRQTSQDRQNDELGGYEIFPHIRLRARKLVMQLSYRSACVTRARMEHGFPRVNKI